MKRRQFTKKIIAATTITGLAGCNTVGQNSDPSNSNPDDENNDNTGDNTDISVSIEVAGEPASLPAIWQDHNIEDFQTSLNIESTGSPTSLKVNTGKTELTPESEQWNNSQVTVQPGQISNGEQEITAIASKNEETTQDKAKVTKDTPGNYKLDVVPEKNPELRDTISEDADEENYLEKRGGFIKDDPVFNSYNSHKNLSFDKQGVDLAAMEWRHDNDYEQVARALPEESQDFLNSLDKETNDPDIQRAKEGAGFVYPNGEWGESFGHFDYEKFSNAETGEEALDWIHSYLFNWNRTKTNEGPISSEDDIYATVLEQSIEQHTDIKAHAWDFDLDEHGNGLIYTENPDGTEELRIMETIKAPVTVSYSDNDPQMHPLVEDSNYLEPGHKGFNKYWHPLRFGWQGHERSDRWNFEEEKRKASAVVRNIASSLHSDSVAGIAAENQDKLGITTQYLKDFTEKLRTFNQNDTDFQTLYNQSKIIDQFMRDQDNNHVVYGSIENPQYAAVEDNSIINDIWNDKEGQYNNFNQYLENNPSHHIDISTELEPGKAS